MPNVVTANRLTDGVVVYLAADGVWTEEIANARVADDEAETKALEAIADNAVRERIVVGPYPMPVALKDDGAIDPISVRERIRAAHRTTLTKDWYDVPL
jgi:2-keto-4-pentenoate hydratase